MQHGDSPFLAQSSICSDMSCNPAFPSQARGTLVEHLTKFQMPTQAFDIARMCHIFLLKREQICHTVCFQGRPGVSSPGSLLGCKVPWLGLGLSGTELTCAALGQRPRGPARGGVKGRGPVFCWGTNIFLLRDKTRRAQVVSFRLNPKLTSCRPCGDGFFGLPQEVRPTAAEGDPHRHGGPDSEGQAADRHVG